MNLNQIQAFLAVARTLSFTRASEELFLSQQNISVLISNLETDLGCMLFDRRRHGLGLTREGVYYNDFFANEMQTGKRLADQIKLDKERRERCFRFGYSSWIEPFGQIDRAMTAFRCENPGLVFSGCQHNNDVLLRMLHDKELDVAVLPAGQLLGDKAFDYFAFAREEISLCIPEDITDSKLDPGCWGLTLLTVASWNWGVFEWKRIFNQELAELGLAPRIIRVLPNVQSMLVQLETGRCCAVLETRFGVGSQLDGLRRVPLEPNGLSMCSCVCHKDNENPVTVKLVDFLIQFFKE